MKKTFTKEEFENLTQSVITEAMENPKVEKMSSGAFMAFTMTYVFAFAELKKKLFDDNTNIIEITIEKEL